MKNNYVKTAPRTLMRIHNMPADEITALFIIVGWIGKRRQINPVVRLMPYFDIGPGPVR